MQNAKDFKTLVNFFIELGLQVIPLLGIVALLVFMVGVGRFIRSSGQSKEQDKGMLTYGLVGLFVLFTIWGIILFLQREFGFQSDVFIPQIHIN